VNHHAKYLRTFQVISFVSYCANSQTQQPESNSWTLSDW